MAKRQAAVVLAGMFVLAFYAGCSEPKLTFQRWETVHEGQTPVAVEQCLGAPGQKMSDQWVYQDHDRHITAHVYWNEDGTKVICKQWYDPEAGWHGKNPAELGRQDPGGTTINQRTNSGTID